jgi:hypothetical protein
MVEVTPLYQCSTFRKTIETKAQQEKDSGKLREFIDSLVKKRQEEYSYSQQHYLNFYMKDISYLMDLLDNLEATKIKTQEMENN